MRMMAAAAMMMSLAWPAAAEDVPTVMLFSMEHCGPCEILKADLMPVLEESGLDAVEWNMDEPDGDFVARKHSVDAAPTVIGFVRRQEIERFQGPRPATELRAFAKRLADVAAFAPPSEM